MGEGGGGGCWEAHGGLLGREVRDGRGKELHAGIPGVVLEGMQP